jgi:hypothetical protein
VLAHIEPGIDKEMSLVQAGEAFDGEVVLATPGLEIGIAKA